CGYSSHPLLHSLPTRRSSDLIPEASDEPTYDDMLFEETGRIARETALSTDDDDTHEVDEEGEERVREKFLPLHARIAAMTITQRSEEHTSELQSRENLVCRLL